MRSKFAGKTPREIAIERSLEERTSGSAKRAADFYYRAKLIGKQEPKWSRTNFVDDDADEGNDESAQDQGGEVPAPQPPVLRASLTHAVLNYWLKDYTGHRYDWDGQVGYEIEATRDFFI